MLTERANDRTVGTYSKISILFKRLYDTCKDMKINTTIWLLFVCAYIDIYKMLCIKKKKIIKDIFQSVNGGFLFRNEIIINFHFFFIFHILLFRLCIHVLQLKKILNYYIKYNAVYNNRKTIYVYFV